MSKGHDQANDGGSPTLTMRGGGWVIVLGAFLVVAVLIWAFAGVWLRSGPRSAPARTVQDFGFDLFHSLVPREQIVIGSEGRDFIRALDQPRMISPADVDRINEEERGKYLVSSDRVIGVVINGEARAYPLRMLDWHEVVNDTVGGVPIAATYNGLCDSAVVFDRRVDGRELTFSASGLLLNSNLLLYNRASGGENESLWSQLQHRAITGPAAVRGDTLTALPSALVSWADWRRLHPETKVLERNPDPSLEKYYKRRTYGHYFSSDELRFPVEPLPEGGRALKTPIVSVRVNDAWHAFAIEDIQARAGANGSWKTTINGVPLSFECFDNPPSVRVIDAEGKLVPVIYSFWFAWYAHHPGAALE